MEDTLSDTNLIADIQGSLDYSVITSNIFLNLNLKQVLEFCESHDNRNIKICNNLYVWRKYFEKNFNKEYNEYIQSLFEIYEETSDFYYKRIQYMYLRSYFPEIGNVKNIGRIKRSERSEHEDESNIENITMKLAFMSPSDMEDHIRETIRSRDFVTFYQLVVYAAQREGLTKYIQLNLRFFFFTGFERKLPLEFIELAYLKLGITTDNLLRDQSLLYGTRYYLDSIKQITKDKISFYAKILFPFIEDSERSEREAKRTHERLDTKDAFIKFAGNFQTRNIVDIHYMRKHKEFKPEITISYVNEEPDPMKFFENVLVFFILSLRYLDYEEETIQEIANSIRRFLRDTDIVLEERRRF